MSENVKFVLNRKAFQDQVLYGATTAEALAAALNAAAPTADVRVESSSNARGTGRARARAYGTLPSEAASGDLSRILGAVRI